MKKPASIIVKKVKKGGHGGHHGGAWKVAYADFVTAMMAFFLLLWLLSMVSDEKRARISAYFKYFSIYTSGGTSWMEKSSEIFAESGENKQKVFKGMQGESIRNAESLDTLIQNFEKDLKEDIGKKLGDVKDQVIVDMVDEGIRIQVVDNEGSIMFQKGEKTLTPKARKVLTVIAEDIKDLTNQIIIEGHTDALPYSEGQYSNWELSTERASSARQVLEAAGLDPKRITRVAGYADTDPLIKDNSRDPRNRRISITIKIPEKERAAMPVMRSRDRQMQDVSREAFSLTEGDFSSDINNDLSIAKTNKSRSKKKSITGRGSTTLQPAPARAADKDPLVKELVNPVFE